MSAEANCLREVSNVPIAHDMKVTNKQEMIKIPVGHLRVISEGKNISKELKRVGVFNLAKHAACCSD